MKMASAKRNGAEAASESEGRDEKKNSAYETTSVAATDDEYHLFRRSATAVISARRDKLSTGAFR